ncbi:unnamed protein product [Adineta ricciae]|uniref:G-protein coupled receptors family 1 profile domain-containing protein n=1 Tax=Adineta ricciae TaxID=249248 RepID=A0A815LML1_ADIRI|nr:unnamed protein product [Adineta ricciae]
MVDTISVIYAVQAIILTLTIPMSLIYLLTIIFIERFHTANNILTANFCSICFICVIYWALYRASSVFHFYPYYGNTAFCTFVLSAGQYLNCLLIYSLTLIAISRYLTIRFPTKRLFKRKYWIYSTIILQWIFSSSVSIPIILDSLQGCKNGLPLFSWNFLYYLLIIVIIPVIIYIIFNGLILAAVRSSSRRVREITTIIVTTTNTDHQQNRRDIKLLKHIFFLFFVFIFGWGPAYIATVIANFYMPLWVYYLLQTLPVFTIIIQILDLFIYNHEVRQYWKERMFRCLHINLR